MWRFTTRQKQAYFEELTRPHLDGLYRAALRMTRHAETAEDLAQETCLKAYKALATRKPGTPYKAWLFKILANTYIDTYVRKREPEMVDYDVYLDRDHVNNPWYQASTEPEACLADKRFRQDVLDALARLTPERRMVVILALFEGFSYEEIAQVMGCPVGTVRSRLQRSRQQLQHYLRAYAASEQGVDRRRRQNGTIAVLYTKGDDSDAL